MPLSRAIALVALALMVALSVGYAYARDGEAGLNLYGFSYHFERDKAKELGTDNEFNPGVGARYIFSEEKQLSWFGETGIYRDSGRNTALFAGGGLLYKLTENLRVGGALALFHSDTYNDGNAFIAPLPLLSYDWRMLSFNMVVFPKVSGINEINTLGFWLTFWPKRKQ